MPVQERNRLGTELEERGHVMTSYGALGIDNFDSLAADVIRVVNANPQLQPERADGRIGMVMCKDEASKEVGARLVRPVVEVLFPQTELWVPYTVNHYETGHFFKPHQDYLDGTVMIATASGTREIDVYRKETEDDVFEVIDHTYELTAGTILLLNGYLDLGHAARCTQGPSISVVGDVSDRINIDPSV